MRRVGWPSSILVSKQQQWQQQRHTQKTTKGRTNKRIIDVTRLCFLGIVCSKYVSSNCHVKFYCVANSSNIIVVTRQVLLCIRE